MSKTVRQKLEGPNFGPSFFLSFFSYQILDQISYQILTGAHRSADAELRLPYLVPNLAPS